MNVIKILPDAYKIPEFNNSPVIKSEFKKQDNIKSDSFYSRHKKAVIAGSAAAVIIGLFAAAKKGILGETLKNYINNIFCKKTPVKSIMDEYNDTEKIIEN